jgi:serine/threonine-protein kinase
LADADTKPPPGDEEEKKFWTRNRLIAAGVIVALLIAGALVYFLTRSTATLPVPKVTGELQQQATRNLKRKGFVVATSPTPSSSPVGRVIEQDPPAGKVVDKGSTVTISVSTGPGPGTVPNVVGLTLPAAEKDLRKHGFKFSVQKSYSNAVKGHVISQVPPANSHHLRGISVTLTVSRGPHLVTVPSVVGEQQADAETAIRDAGLEPRSVTTNSNSPAGQVTNEDPGAGNSIRVGSVVTLTISNGAGTVIVPNVVGRLQADAEAALRSAGVRRITVVHTTTTNQSEDGRVISQQPSAGRRIPDTISVTITVARFKQTTTTPSTTTPSTTTPSTTTGGGGGGGGSGP